MDIKVAAIIPNRGEERKLFYYYQEQRARNMGFDKVYLINYPPKNNDFDLFERIATGVAMAKADGIDYVSIIESDDHYDLGYLDEIKKHIEGNDIIGINRTTYYHLFSTGYKVMLHPGRSSMFCTSFRTDLFSKFPTAGAPYHDLSIWKFVQERGIAFRLLDKDIALGIKHGGIFGKVGGGGHFMEYPATDPKLQWLKQRVDAEAFTFYTELKNTFQNTWAHGRKA
jgi:hypothetical protein